MNSLTTIAFHMLDAHSGEVSKMMYFEDDKLLVTGSADRSIKVEIEYFFLNVIKNL